MTTWQEGRRLDHVKRLHVTQDSDGSWLLSLENEDGSLKLLAHSFPSRELLLHEAETFAEHGRFQGAEVLADPPKAAQNLEAAAASTEADSTEGDSAEYVPPQPKRVRGP